MTTTTELRAEYGGFLSRLSNAADITRKSEDRKELVAFLDLINRMQTGLYRADAPTQARLVELDIEERWANV